MRGDLETVEVELTYLRETDRAVQFKDADDREFWLPRSTFSGLENIEPDEGATVMIDVAEWKARQEGLI